MWPERIRPCLKRSLKMVQKMEIARTQLESLSDDQLLGEGLVARLRDWEVKHRLWVRESELRAMSDRELLGDLVGLLREVEVGRRLELAA
jgi:hypothetical protein